MSERRVKPSHPDADKLAEYAKNIAIGKSPQRWFNTHDVDPNSPEWQAWVKENEQAMQELLEGGAFRDEYPDFF